MITSAPRVLHRQSDEFDERNLFLQVTLGFVSLAARLDEVLARHAPDRPDVSFQEGSDEPAHPAELLLLGAIATAHALRGRLDAAIPLAADTPPLAPSRTVPVRPDSLRRWLT